MRRQGAGEGPARVQTAELALIHPLDGAGLQAVQFRQRFLRLTLYNENGAHQRSVFSGVRGRSVASSILVVFLLYDRPDVSPGRDLHDDDLSRAEIDCHEIRTRPV